MTLFDKIQTHDGVVNAVRIGDTIEAYGEIHGEPNEFIHHLATHLKLLDDYIVLIEQRPEACSMSRIWMEPTLRQILRTPGVPELYASLRLADASNIRCIDPRDDAGFQETKYHRDVAYALRDFTKDPDDTRYVYELLPTTDDLIKIVKRVKTEFYAAGHSKIYEDYWKLIHHDYTIVSDHLPIDDPEGYGHFSANCKDVDYIGACAHRLNKNLYQFAAVYFDITIDGIISEYIAQGRKAVLFVGAAHVHRLGDSPLEGMEVTWLKKTPSTMVRRCGYAPITDLIIG